MTKRQQQLIRETWARLAPDARSVGERFYGQLFALHPEARALFVPTRLVDQEEKFVRMLEEIIRVAEAPRALIQTVGDLGRRHGTYGVRPEHYPMVTTALLAVLADGLGPAWTPEVRAAWREALTLVGAIMQRGADKSVPPS